jgi:hypothetical protein
MFHNREGEQMRQVWAVVALAGAFAVAEAGGDSGPVRTAQGGFVTKSGHYQFDVYFYRTGVRVFPQRPEGTPLAVSGLVGTATFYHPNSPEVWFSRPLRSAPSASSLDLAIGLGDVPAAGVNVTVVIDGLPEPSEPMATFTLPLEFVTASSLGGVVASTKPARPRGGVPPQFPMANGLSYKGLSDSLITRHGTTSPPMSPSSVSLSGYGRVPSSPSPGGPLPFVSGHAVFVMPSAGRDVPLARPWLRPMD